MQLHSNGAPVVPLNLIKAGTRQDDGLDHLREKAYHSAMTGSVKNLLSVGKDAKTVKGEKYGVITGVLYLAPANVSGFEVCPARTKGCSAACLFTAGQGRFNNVKQGRIRRTLQFELRRDEFFKRLVHEIDFQYKKANVAGMDFAVRLNGTSDIAWERYPLPAPAKYRAAPHIFSALSHVTFYDYTKDINRLGKILTIPNYHITFSRGETEKNHNDTALALQAGVSATVVFRKKLPSTWIEPVTGIEYPVIDGDRHDIRFWDGLRHDGGPVIIGLLAKGDAKKDETGFVIDL